MDIYSIDSQYIPLSSLHWLTSPADSTEPRLLTVSSEETGRLIFKGMLHPGLDGYYHIDIYDVMSAVISEKYNFISDDGYEEGVGVAIGYDSINITLGAVDVSTKILHCESSPYSTNRPDTDILLCPDTGDLRFELPMFAARQVVKCELNNGQVIDIPKASFIPAVPGDYLLKYLDLDALPKDASAFRVIVLDQDSISFSSPSYHMTAGDWQHFYFLNNFGHFEDIPMCGEASERTEFDIKTASLQYSDVQLQKKSKRIYTQNSGSLTKASYSRLISLLEGPCIFDRWENRLIVTKVEAHQGTNDDVRSVTFEYTLN